MFKVVFRLKKPVLLFMFATSLFAQERGALPKTAYVQSIDSLDLKENYKYISISEVIEQGLRKNFSQINREKDEEILKLNWSDTYQSFWFPTLSLSLKSKDHRIGRLRKGGKSGGLNDTAPNGTLALELKEYTVFNWGRDYMKYLNDRETYIRERDRLAEQRRDLKHDLITEYFSLERAHKTKDIFKEQLRHSSFLYRLNREKASLKKISRKEYYLARTDYLRAQSEYHQALDNAQLSDSRMVKMIADAPGTRYLLREGIKYSKINIPLSSALDMAKKSNPKILDGTKNLENAKRSHFLTLKNNLPLPKITLNLGAYTHRFSRSEHRTRYETSPGSSAVDLVASVNATWTLTGKGGLLNMRDISRSRLKKYRAFNERAEAVHTTETLVDSLYRSIKSLENEMTILEARYANIQKTFGIVLDSYLKRRIEFYQYQEILKEKIAVGLLQLETKFKHMQSKIDLARLLGVDDLEGELFEKQIEVEKK